MSSKAAPLGVCDLCGGPIEEPYTSKGKPRRYCSRDCRNTGNSRAGSEARRRKVLQRIDAGQWVNPVAVRPLTSEEQAARARKGRLREVEAGVWRNPAQAEEARAKLSRPRKHDGPLAEAIERLRQGVGMAGLTLEQAEAYRAHARARQRRRWADMTEEEREQRRAQWRAYARRRSSSSPQD